MTRILVTGSRDWDDWRRVISALVEHWDYSVTIVHGACPTGADEITDWLCKNLFWHLECIMEVERHPADWEKYGRRAGFIRNDQMVQLGADICLAFIRNGSKGATMTADIAEAAGIPVLRIIQNDPA